MLISVDDPGVGSCNSGICIGVVSVLARGHGDSGGDPVCIAGEIEEEIGDEGVEVTAFDMTTLIHVGFLYNACSVIPPEVFCRRAEACDELMQSTIKSVSDSQALDDLRVQMEYIVCNIARSRWTYSTVRDKKYDVLFALYAKPAMVTPQRNCVDCVSFLDGTGITKVPDRRLFILFSSLSGSI